MYNVPLQSAAAFHVISVVIAHSTLSFAFASSRATLDPDERPASRISYSEASQDRYRYHVLTLLAKVVGDSVFVVKLGHRLVAIGDHDNGRRRLVGTRGYLREKCLVSTLLVATFVK